MRNIKLHIMVISNIITHQWGPVLKISQMKSVTKMFLAKVFWERFQLIYN